MVRREQADLERLLRTNSIKLERLECESPTQEKGIGQNVSFFLPLPRTKADGGNEPIL